MDEIDRACYLHPADSISESNDSDYFKEEFSQMSLEEKFERGLIDEETYDAQRKLKDLK